MYYFIFEQPLTRKQSEVAQQIEDAVVAGGIAGELAVADVYTDIDGLLASAHHKGFQTVVVVGSARLANHVAARLIRYEMVLGIVPWEEAPSLAELTGTPDWQSAIPALKQRRWRYAALGRLGDQGVFLSRVILQIKRSSEIVRLRTTDYAVLFNATNVSLTCTAAGLKEHHVLFECHTVAPELSGWNRLWGKKVEGPFSRFTMEDFWLESEVTLPITLDSETIATTPVRVSTLSRAVRLIVARRHLSPPLSPGHPSPSRSPALGTPEEMPEPTTPRPPATPS